MTVPAVAIQGGRARAFGNNTGPRWCEAGGQRFYARSRWEANYGRYLAWLHGLGEIAAWAHEPTTFWFEGIRRGVCSYKPDFSVTETGGALHYDEVKGFMSDQNRTALRRMAKYHPGIRIVVIEAKIYHSIAASASRLIPGWE